MGCCGAFGDVPCGSGGGGVLRGAASSSPPRGGRIAPDAGAGAAAETGLLRMNPLRSEASARIGPRLDCLLLAVSLTWFGESSSQDSDETFEPEFCSVGDLAASPTVSSMSRGRGDDEEDRHVTSRKVLQARLQRRDVAERCDDDDDKFRAVWGNGEEGVGRRQQQLPKR